MHLACPTLRLAPLCGRHIARIYFEQMAFGSAIEARQMLKRRPSDTESVKPVSAHSDITVVRYHSMFILFGKMPAPKVCDLLIGAF